MILLLFIAGCFETTAPSPPQQPPSLDTGPDTGTE